jgi:hypothetical protein
MPLLIDASEAAAAICDGPQCDRTQIVLPLPMAC